MPGLPPPAAPAPRRGRPRKWPDEATRRAHEAAKRRLRNQAGIALDDFHDRTALVAQLDELQATIKQLRAERKDLLLSRSELFTSEQVNKFRRADRDQIANLRAYIASLKTPTRQPATSQQPAVNRDQRRAGKKRR